MKNVLPQKEVPELVVKTVNGMKWDLRDEKPENFTLVVFYRGLHCSVCRAYLEDINSRIYKFRERGVNVLCVSANNAKLAEKSFTEWNIEKLVIGHSLSIEAARKWDVFISKGVSNSEPEYFFEPAFFLVNPDNTLYAASIQSMPLGRPRVSDILKAVDFVLERSYPARGGA